MTIFDFCVLAVLGIAISLGLWRGLVRELFGLIGLLASLAITFVYGKEVYALLEPWVKDPSIRLLVAYVGIFLIVMIGSSVISYFVESLVALTHLGFLDHILGMLFGAAKAALLVVFAYVLAGFTPLPDQDWWKNALLKPWVEKGVEYSRPYWPEQFALFVKPAH